MSVFTLPEKCGYCGIKLKNDEEVELDDYKLYHPKCYKKLLRERKKIDLHIRRER